VVQTAIFGAGAWGTALAIHLARRPASPAYARKSSAGSVVLVARDVEQCNALLSEGENRKYLPGVHLDPAIRVVATPAEALAQARLVLLAVPVVALRPLLLQDLGQWAAAGPPRFLVWLCKGLETVTGLLPHQIVAQCCPNIDGAALSGPSFAQEVAAGLPVALVTASRSRACIDAVREAFHHSACRIYASADLVGVELGGALKNVMAIAAGVSDGLGMGNNARAALLTRGLAEIARLGRCLGASPQTFMGLSGLGDLLLTATGDLSRNRWVGIRLAQGESLPSILATLGHVAEGVPAAATALRLAVRHKVDMPITQAVHALLYGTCSPRHALEALLAREFRTESEFAEPLST